jgi:hypothetical protein
MGDAKRQLVEKNPLARCRCCVGWVISPQDIVGWDWPTHYFSGKIPFLKRIKALPLKQLGRLIRHLPQILCER